MLLYRARSGLRWGGVHPPTCPRLALPLVCGCVLRSLAAPRCAGAWPARPLSAAPLRRGSLSPAERRPQTGAAPRRGRPSFVWGPVSGGLRAPCSVALAGLRPSPVPARPTRCGLRVSRCGVASRRNAHAPAWACLWLRPGGPFACSGSVSPLLVPSAYAAARQPLRQPGPFSPAAPPCCRCAAVQG